MLPKRGTWDLTAPRASEPRKPLVSWWTQPDLQTDRAAFQRHLVDEELARLASHTQRFGGRRITHTKWDR